MIQKDKGYVKVTHMPLEFRYVIMEWYNIQRKMRLSNLGKK